MLKITLSLGGLVLATITAHGVTDYTETFTADAANWRITDSVTPMTWIADDGPAGVGDAFIRNTNVTFIGLADGASRLAVRGHSSFNASGGAFIGNWLTSGVFAFSFDVRHHLGVPAKMGARIAAPANSPGASIEATALLPSGQWATLVVPIDPANPGFVSFGAGSFASVFSSVGNLQINLYAPPGFGGAAGPFHLDIDNVTIIITGTAPPVASAPAPNYDRWMYPFSASSPLGNRPTASSFGVLDPDFDNRDAQIYFGFVLTNQIPAGLGPESYEIISCRFAATMSDGNTAYDPTPDAWTSYLDATQALYTADADLGRPMELFGAGWRGGFTPQTFGEDGPFQSLPPPYKGKRNVFALGIRSNQLVDVSNNIDPDGTFTNGFDPIPFATGTAPLTPGDLIPLPTTFTFDLNTSEPLIQTYLQAALNDGILGLVLATLHPSSFMGPAVFPVWDQKESVIGTPATLEITYRVVPELGLALEDDIRVVRWPAASAPVIMETAEDLGNPQWRSQTVLLIHNGDDHAAELTSPAASQFIRLKQPYVPDQVQ